MTLQAHAEQAVSLIAVGLYIPDARMTSAEIAEASGVPQPVVESKLGLRSKPVPGPEDGTCEMGIRAARQALARSGVDPMDIDAVIYIGEEHKEHPVWTAALKLQEEIGARRAIGWDIALRCCTAIAGLKIAKTMMSGDPSLRTVLLAGGYRNGDLIDMADPATRFMLNLSAGGGALILRRDAGAEYPRLLDTALLTDGSFSEDVVVGAGGTRQPLTPELLAAGEPRFRVQDAEAMKERLDRLSMKRFEEVIRRSAADSGCDDPAGLAYLGLLHMKRSAHHHVLRALGVAEERAIYLEDYGHMGQFDPILHLELIARDGRMKPGDAATLAAAGIGYAWGATTLSWGDEPCPWS
ncbi:3-oxoacyl-ACP synthase [Paenibacillus sp. FSL W8-1187]|uniref:3-oxoacyl-[acyl-carrier-protein] synthase, KASIII n=1 Tax=Paenibacillus pasadenensis TaxID=217090 RepID=A0A2N5N6J5_9BACL|nr:3-oxoacyl-ACP synthase [Paenibacillus pasadenensis]PLT45933.1 3-oxoacyl-[acyl-carrier-protein] synthase, KASIII [Paenibacillus pasadenensis]